MMTEKRYEIGDGSGYVIRTGLDHDAVEIAFDKAPPWEVRNALSGLRMQYDVERRVWHGTRCDEEELRDVVEAKLADQTSDYEPGNGRTYRVVDDGSGRIKAVFDGKPPEEIRDSMKRAGMRWSPAGGCWWSRTLSEKAVRGVIERGIVDLDDKEFRGLMERAAARESLEK